MSKIIAVSGGFDPVHEGHIRMFKEAKALGDELIVILNNDAWLTNKKGKPFMKQKERKEIIKAIKYVDKVVLTGHEIGDLDNSICVELEVIRPDIFANGGDRFEDNIPEVHTCRNLGIEMVFNIGGEKINSSSKLIKDSKNE